MRIIITALIILSLVMIGVDLAKATDLRQQDQADIQRYLSKDHLLKPEMAYGYRASHNDDREYSPRNYCGHFVSWDSWQDHLSIVGNAYEGAYYKRGGSLYYEFNRVGEMYVFSVGR